MATLDAQIAHIWRRLGFSATRAEVDAGVAIGPSALIDDLLSRPLVPFSACGFPAASASSDASMVRQLEVMAYGPSASGSGITSPQYHPLQERLTWMLQGLVVIAIVDSVYHADMLDHLALLRTAPSITYRSLLTQVSTRPGMLKYLSGNTNTVSHPNQNYARELAELFALGRVDAATGTANYTQADVTEMARALTGWAYDWNTGGTMFQAYNWDSGQKTFLGAPRGAAGLNEVIAALVGHPAWKTYVPARVYKELVGLTATPTVLAQLAPAWGTDGDLLALVGAIARRPEFLSDQAIMARTKSPVERIVAATRLLGWTGLTTDPNMSWHVNRLNQHPFVAPNVSGWPKGDQWLNATNLQVWCEVANSMAMRGFIWDGSTNGPVNPTVTQVFQNSSAATAAAYVTHLAGIDPVTTKTAAALDAYAKAGPWQLARAAGLLDLVLMSPEFLAN